MHAANMIFLYMLLTFILHVLLHRCVIIYLNVYVISFSDEIMAAEDDVMRKRLTVEGDGGSDDKRIMSLVKTFVRWAQVSQSEEEMEATYQKMLFTLGK